MVETSKVRVGSVKYFQDMDQWKRYGPVRFDKKNPIAETTLHELQKEFREQFLSYRGTRTTFFIYPTDNPRVKVSIGVENPKHLFLTVSLRTNPPTKKDRSYFKYEVFSGPLDYKYELRGIRTGIRNCLDAWEAIRDYPMCNCCGVPRIEYIHYPISEFYTGRAKEHLGVKGAQMVQFVEQNPRYLSPDGLRRWICPICNDPLYPWESADRDPRIGKVHEFLDCPDGGAEALKWVQMGVGKIRLQCKACFKSYSELEAKVLNLGR